jgi:hypothetical protein
MSNDAGSVKSFLKTGPPSQYSSNRARAVKELFDSDYVKPTDNYRVFQDNNPLKNAAHKEALDRFESKLKRESNLATHHLSDHQRRIHFDVNEKEREVEEKVNKQKLFNDQIQEQMRLNVSFHLFVIIIIFIFIGGAPSTKPSTCQNASQPWLHT